MEEIKFWDFLSETIKQDGKAIMLLVAASKGSSPGRAGFKLALSPGGASIGTIGGGKVEHNLIKDALNILHSDSPNPVLSNQIHNPEEENSSGMICSGEQSVIIYPLNNSHFKIISDCLQAVKKYEKTHFVIKPDSFEYINLPLKPQDHSLEIVGNSWIYKENLYKMTEIHIFGAGHVCLALTELITKLGFYITIYDDRKDLSMMDENHFVHEKKNVDYNFLTEHIVDNPEAYYLIMTHSHLGDAKVLSQLINKPYKYLGMLGSPSKVKEIYSGLLEDGIPKEKFLKVHAPVGVQIKSKTVHEIAVSIAAELIKIRNS